MILFPTIPEQKARIGTPIVPRNKKDPTQSAQQVSRMFNDIEGRYLEVKRRLKAVFGARMTGLERVDNCQQSWMVCNNEDAEPSLYQVNAGTYIYDMTAAQLADLLQVVQTILDDSLLDGGSQNLWALDYVAAEYERGTHAAYTNLSLQSSIYATQTTLQQLLSSPAYQNQIASAYISTYSDWKGISDSARADLANIIADAIGRGINPRETANIVSKRLDVSMSRAKTIAQTEQVGALRQAQWNETDWASERLGLRTGLMWLSALRETTRRWHAARHGHVYTTEEVRDFYAEGGNRYNCYCSQIPCLLNEDGTIYNEGLADKLNRERKAWAGYNDTPVRSQITTPEYTPPVYETLKNVTRVNAWAKGNISENAKIPAGSNIEQLNNCMALTLDLQERFNLPKLRYIGSVTGDDYNYKRSKGMIGGYAHGTNAMLVTRNAFDAKDLLDVDSRARLAGFTAESLKKAEKIGSKGLVDAVKSAEAISWQAVPTPRGIFAHEFGHALHRTFPLEIDKLGKEAFDNGWQYALSKYGQTKYSEYVAEAFSLYIEDPAQASRRLYPPLLNVFRKMDKSSK